MSQLELNFDVPCQRHSPTSVAAAESVKELTGELQLRVYRHFVKADERGLTDEELFDEMGGNPNGLRPRRVELVRANWIKDSGTTRPTRSGRSATVWVVVALLLMLTAGCAAPSSVTVSHGPWKVTVVR